MFSNDRSNVLIWKVCITIITAKYCHQSGTKAVVVKQLYPWNVPLCQIPISQPISYHSHHLRFLGKKTDSRAERYSDNNNLRSELTLRFSPTPVSFWTASNAEQIMHQKMTQTCPLGLTLLLFPAWGQQALSPPRCGGPGWGGSWPGAPSQPQLHYIFIDLG